jgi:hypothetical protein
MEELNEKQQESLNWFIYNPPKFYKLFYKIYSKLISPSIFILMLISLIIGILHSILTIDFFNFLKTIFFILLGLGLLSLCGFLYKHIYTKRYANKIMGISLKTFNKLMEGKSWDI